MIWYTCKQCGKCHGRPDETAGSLVFCECGQGNRVPWQSTAPPPETPPRPEPERRTPGPGWPRPEERPPPRWPALRRRDPAFCLNHEDAPSDRKCAACGEMFCSRCVVALQGRTLCGPCKNYQLAQQLRPPVVSGMAVFAIVLGLTSAPVACGLTLIPLAQQQEPSTVGAIVLGLIGLVLPVAALVVGLLALREIDANPRVGGRALAMTGTANAALGVLWCMAIAGILIARQLLE